MRLAGLCKGSTADSDSVCEGSNPSPAAKTTDKVGGFFIFLRSPVSVPPWQHSCQSRRKKYACPSTQYPIKKGRFVALLKKYCLSLDRQNCKGTLTRRLRYATIKNVKEP